MSPHERDSIRRITEPQTYSSTVEVCVNRVQTPDPMRVTPPPPEVMQVVEVVLGWSETDESHPLTGWQLDDAIAAMTALGDSNTHIAWRLGIHPHTVRKKLTPRGIKPNYVDRRLDCWGIWVALRGGRIALRGRDRIAAVRMLARRGIDNAEIARRLMMKNPATVTQLAVRHNIDIVAAKAWPSEVKLFLQQQSNISLAEEKAVDSYVRHLLGSPTPQELIAA